MTTCSRCGEAVTKDVAFPMQSDRGIEWVCPECRWLDSERVAARLRRSLSSVNREGDAYLERWTREQGSAYDPPDPQLGELPCIRVGARTRRFPVHMLERMGL